MPTPIGDSLGQFQIIAISGSVLVHTGQQYSAHFFSFPEPILAASNRRDSPPLDKLPRSPAFTGIDGYYYTLTTK